jgi:hypothetical protein
MKDLKEKKVEKFETTKQEIANLEQVFTLARVQIVNNSPNDKKALVDIINFEAQFIEKLNGNNSNNTRE